MTRHMQLSHAQLTDLTGKSVIVTGGAMGIGLGIAFRLAEAGAKVVIADFNETEGEKAAADLTAKGFTASFIKTDASDEASVKAAIAFAETTYGGLDILVNNAGVYPMAPVLGLPTETIDKVLGLNLKGVMLFSREAATLMVKQGRGGKIINVSSIDAVHPSGIGLAVYDASKHGVWGFTKNLALELAPHGIQVNAIAPGSINTPGTGAGQPASPELDAIRKKFAERIPMKRSGEPDDIGKVALFLASDLSSYMTGEQVVVDGGVLLT